MCIALLSKLTDQSGIVHNASDTQAIIHGRPSSWRRGAQSHLLCPDTTNDLNDLDTCESVSSNLRSADGQLPVAYFPIPAEDVRAVSDRCMRRANAITHRNAERLSLDMCIIK
jgi:hypothetical protein